MDTIPLRVELPGPPLDPLGSSPTSLFVGGFGHLPNVDAAVRLASRVFPRVRDAARGDPVPGGRQAPAEVRRLAGAHVVVDRASRRRDAVPRRRPRWSWRRYAWAAARG